MENSNKIQEVFRHLEKSCAKTTTCFKETCAENNTYSSLELDWQELKRMKEKRGEDKGEPEAKAGKKWTLEGEESDDDDVLVFMKAHGDVPGFENGNVVIVDSEDENMSNGEAMKIDKSDANVEDEIDPLDAFMNTLVTSDMENLNNTAENSMFGNEIENEAKRVGSKGKRTIKNTLGRIIPGEESDTDNEEDEDFNEDQVDDENGDEFMKRMNKTKIEKQSIVDHSKV